MQLAIGLPKFGHIFGHCTNIFIVFPGVVSLIATYLEPFNDILAAKAIAMNLSAKNSRLPGKVYKDVHEKDQENSTKFKRKSSMAHDIELE